MSKRLALPRQDPDPTVAAVAAYDMTAAEIVIGWFLLAATPLMYLGRMDGKILLHFSISF